MHDRCVARDPAGVLGRVVEMAHIGFGLVDSGGTITSANPRLAEILGRPDPVGLTLAELGLGLGSGPRSCPDRDRDPMTVAIRLCSSIRGPTNA